jgi:hypothetical protein
MYFMSYEAVMAVTCNWLNVGAAPCGERSTAETCSREGCNSYTYIHTLYVQVVGFVLRNIILYGMYSL